MKLIALQLCNFRQFYGKTPIIKFASGKQNTTVIYGNNGSGKTTILNAFTWVLYEKFTAAFAAPEVLINKRAIAEANFDQAVEFWVEIQFEHDYKRYQLKRKGYANKNKENYLQSNPTKLFILIAADDGRWYPPVEPAEDIIERILPVSLHQYFFFDGERIDHFFRADRNNNIAEDTKELLGVKVLDRAIDHLKKAKKSLQEELEAIGDSTTKKILQQQIQLESERDRLTTRQEEIIQTIKGLESKKKAITHQLLELSGAEKLQKLKEKLVAQEKLIRQNLIQAKLNLKQLVSNQGYLVFLLSTKNNFFQFLQQLRNERQLSSGIKREFLEQLLKNQTCICGEKLEPDTQAYHQVHSWLNKSETTDLEESVIRLETQVNQFQLQLTEFWQQIDRLQHQINHQYTEIAKIENELDKVNKQLRNYPDRDIQKYQENLEFIEEKIKELTLEQGVNQQQLSSDRKIIEGLNQQIERHKLKEDKQALVKKRIAATQEAIQRLIEVRLRLEKQFRVSLEQKIQEIFRFISFTPYVPKLNLDYQLTLVENTLETPTIVAASTGENQILSLSFIGAIIDRVREWSQRNTLMGLDSSTFPIVMDSPFGSLDEVYRRKVAKSLPQLANQLVVLVTKTQWCGEVEAEITDYIGKEYVLIYNSSKPNCEEDWLKLNRINYPLVKLSSNQFEYTEIVEIQRESENH
ncbi:MAG: SMC family ATPase [Stanieria sp.]